jgi:hypothetical protein
MANIINIKVDVTQVDKARLFKGEKGVYLHLTLFPSKDDKFGDTHFVKQEISKEERLAGVRLPIIGNAKERFPVEQPPAPVLPAENTVGPTEPLPF